MEEEKLESYKYLAYYNGEISEYEDMMVPMADRGFYFGDGVYDATIAGNGVIHDLDLHVDRFFNSARMLQMELEYTKEELKDLLYDLLKKADPSYETVFVYFQATRGTAPRGHAFPKAKTNLCVTLSDYGKLKLHPHIDAITYPDKRFEYCNIKTLNLIPSILAAQASEAAGVGESIFLRPGNIVTECAHSNISFIKDRELYTHPADEFILPGLGRANIIRKCKELGIPVHEEEYTLDQLMDADEIMVSASGRFCLAVDHIDGTPVGGKDKEMIDKIQVELMNDYLKEIGRL